MKERSEILEEQAALMLDASHQIIGNAPSANAEMMGLSLVLTGLAVILGELADMRKMGEQGKSS